MTGSQIGVVAVARSAEQSRQIETLSGKNRGTENFPVGSLLIRPDLRAHVHAFYNFARAADDIGDHPLMDPKAKLARLNRMGDALVKSDVAPARDDEERRLDAIAYAMKDSLKATGVAAQHCIDLLHAFKQDSIKLRYADWDDLIDYCNHSAAPVGRHVLALHGIGESAWPANDALCNALQIINHIQDCADDYRELDRVYIPQDMLAEKGGYTADLSREVSTPALRDTLQAMLDKTEALMPPARDLPRRVPDARLKCETSIIYTLAEKLIALLRRRDPLCDTVKLGKLAVMGAGITGLVRAWL